MNFILHPLTKFPPKLYGNVFSLLPGQAPPAGFFVFAANKYLINKIPDAKYKYKKNHRFIHLKPGLGYCIRWRFGLW